MSLRTRLVLLFLAITAAAVGFVYLYVVPQLRSSLTAQNLSRLEDESTRQARRLEDAMDRRPLPGPARRAAAAGSRRSPTRG